MAKVTFRPPVVEDAARLAHTMRPLDYDEMVAASGPDVEQSLFDALRVSTHAWAADYKGELLALFGFAPYGLLSDTAAPWCIATPELTRVPGMLARSAARYFASVRLLYPRLVNYVDARNTPSIRWLKAMGFEVSEEAELVGYAQLPFYRFEMGT